MSFVRNILAQPRSARRKAAVAGAAAVLGATGLALGVTPAMAAPASVATGAQGTARAMIGNEAQFQCFSNIVSHESGWNPSATNASSGAYGLVQALPGSKMASAGADWKTNPSTQIKWGVDYMNSRYGSPCAAWTFWQANHWY
ncbi:MULTISPECIES: transglycosylase SLT domain-containing protein [unclassified Streptomyces]|uniref:aggregation-promoting factor C-terminal-like domain-containing protein n=1 Tax=unclassified Streptomyces TaxID=2593676 RepID=UPI002DD9C93B|nr:MULTISPECIES: transglycosylase SLT domain-containing protein [unclassified Streptomyces]WSF87003.1 lytic transglycosylase domain-containing protein [Streptomyces sp. NBC_01744]WSC36756.1 lytic transglycosylase domain-containing protein [Streptomyces sp. NBC_01763]WSC44852.1 lytic transglycosylase domain-containing protein [Streptomyces sp. NBC_01762]WSC56166.1 lytic transglycosylase domain-containing protein [Streptomyces sp. NBC_01761]WSD24439.1 lytic transglycosylase domain-containing pro